MTQPATRSARRRAAIAGAAVATVAFAALALPPTASALPSTATAAHSGAPAAHGKAADAVQRSLDRLVEVDGLPGVMASVRGRDGRVRTYTAGVGNLRTKSPVPRDSHVRIASNTKSFTATVVLQLVGEGRISLGAPVERYLPGVVRGNGNDGRHITVKQLLQQTSGLPDYDTIVTSDLLAVRHTYFEPRQLLDAALSNTPLFAPGTSWSYSNTNYVLAGLIAERVTGRPIGELITQRVIDRIGLEHTYWPNVGEQSLRGRHAQGYYAAEPGARWVDITNTDPSLGWAAGQLVSTPSDLLAFDTALLAGRLLRPAEQAQLTSTVSAPEFEQAATGTWRYGLGFGRVDLPCGGLAWGHGGDIQGFETRNLVTSDGRGAVIATTALPTSVTTLTHVVNAVRAAICSS